MSLTSNQFNTGGKPLFVEGESNTPLIVSVIVPVYNVAPYLTECIESIINQTYEHLEIILVDDGSTDGSGAICDDYARQDPRIKVIHKENGGLSSARNAGMDIMTGALVSFVDSDDYLVLTMIERCVQKFRAYPQVDVVRFAWLEFDDAGKQNLIYSIETNDKIFSPEEGLKLWMKAECSHSAWSSVFKAELVREFRFKEGVYAEDLEFMLKLYLAKPINTLFIQDALYMYRVNNQGITQSKTNLMWRDAFTHWGNALQQMKTVNPKKAAQIAYGLFLQVKILENRHRFWRTGGEALRELQELFAPTYKLLEHSTIDFSLSPNP